MRLNLQYRHSNNVGYGRHGIELHRGLTASGVEVFDHLPVLGEPHGPRHSGVAPVVCWLCVPAHVAGWADGQYRVSYTMWEGSRLPETFRDAVTDFDLVVVPSVENVELFSQHHDNVKLVYEGVNPDVWNYVAREPPGRFFDFLIGGSGERKGVDLAFDAFVKVFGNWTGDGPVPRLIVKSPRGENFSHERVQVISGKLSDEAEVALYASAHCYVQPSRGEGFGLQPLQALAQGCPTILTDAHGHKAYSHLGVGISASLAKAGYFVYGDAGDWWEPDFGELCDAMRDVYDNYERHLASAKVASEVVASEWTWQRSAEMFIGAVGEDRLNAPAPSSGARLVKPTLRRYRVVTQRDLVADIGDASYRFTGGRTYWETSDVKRVLRDAGILDPVSLADDTGLSPDQVKRIPNFTAASA